MYLIVGLGNPTSKYEHTRHNAGFDCLEVLAAKLSVRIHKIRCKALIGEGRLADEKIILAEPQTFMNLSGEAVAALMNHFRIGPDHLIVIYDDTDLDTAKIRIRKNGSAGGHNGMKNIIRMIGTQEFTRIRIGIGKRPEEMEMVDYVLGRFPKEERRQIEEAFVRAADAAQDIVENGVDHAMNHFN